jgi:hypothetical protein
LASAFAGGFIENSRMQDYLQSLRLSLDDGYVMNSNILTIVQPTVTVEILNETIKGPVCRSLSLGIVLHYTYREGADR